MEISPAGVASNPRDARVKGATIPSPTDDQPPPREEGEAVSIPWLRQVRDEAGVGERAREYFDAGEPVLAFTAAHQDLP